MPEVPVVSTAVERATIVVTRCHLQLPVVYPLLRSAVAKVTVERVAVVAAVAVAAEVRVVMVAEVEAAAGRP